MSLSTVCALQMEKMERSTATIAVFENESEAMMVSCVSSDDSKSTAQATHKVETLVEPCVCSPTSTRESRGDV